MADERRHVVLVTGGRDYANREQLWAALDQEQPTMVVHGGASGADCLAAAWAQVHGVPVRCYLADWQKHGRAAGPIRNRSMLLEEQPDVVRAFPGGKGTADCVRQALLLAFVVKVAP